jgi:hypothetical protein
MTYVGKMGELVLLRTIVVLYYYKNYITTILLQLYYYKKLSGLINNICGLRNLNYTNCINMFSKL